jgi:hypothetical protein
LGLKSRKSHSFGQAVATVIMTFGHGAYIIKSLSLDSYVGRDLTEDRSLLPKKVFVLEKGVEAPQVCQLDVYLHCL